LSRLHALPNVRLLLSSHANRLVVEEITLGNGTIDRQVTGVVYTNPSSEEIHLSAKTVVVCTGGYMASRGGSSLLAEFTADLCSLATVTGTHADGEGIKMVRAVGGQLTQMTNVQLDAFGIINQGNPSAMSKDLLPSLIRFAGAIVINSQGKRICNEFDSSKKMSAAVLQHCSNHSVRLTSGREQPVAYVLINQKVLSCSSLLLSLDLSNLYPFNFHSPLSRLPVTSRRMVLQS
jgi:succinate dehydrogenase/fumarate reductase flavoprotein subunit